MILGVGFNLVSCEEEEQELPIPQTEIPEATGTQESDYIPTEEIVETEELVVADDGKIDVIRILQGVKIGERIVKSDIEVVRANPENMPEGTFADTANVIGKYAKMDLVAGDIVIADKISASKPTYEEIYGIAPTYINVRDEIEGVSDVAARIQEIIDKNPGSTLYFSDGIYMLDRPLKTSGNPSKMVSFKCSAFAVFKASSKWSGKAEDALIQFGAKDKATSNNNKAQQMASCYFTGGYVDGVRMASGISVESGCNVLIQNFSIYNTRNGITIKGDYCDVDNGVIRCDGTKDAIGVLVQGRYNTLNTMRISGVEYGIKVTKSDNVFRNLHPLYYPINTKTSIGFWDLSEGNFYDMCYSDQFAVGFSMVEKTRSVYNSCFAFWYSSKKDQNKHWGFESKGAFNSCIRNCRVDLYHDGDGETPGFSYIYLKVGSAANSTGWVIHPIWSGVETDESWRAYLHGQEQKFW